MPTLEDYFKSKSEGKHPFEEEAYKFEEEDELKQQRQKEAEYDEELYMRELKGRLYGEKITPR